MDRKDRHTPPFQADPTVLARCDIRGSVLEPHANKRVDKTGLGHLIPPLKPIRPSPAGRIQKGLASNSLAVNTNGVVTRTNDGILRRTMGSPLNIALILSA